MYVPGADAIRRFASATISSRSPKLMAAVGQTVAHAGFSPASTRSAQNVHLWISGARFSQAYLGIRNGHACMQARQPMQRFWLKTTGPSAVLLSAVVGHAEAQAGWSQCMQSWRPKTQSGRAPLVISLNVMIV